MKLSFTLALLILASQALCFAEELTYKVTPNKDRFPFPRFVPVLSSDSRDHFDWKRYVDEALSPADRLYRLRLGPPEQTMGVPGAGQSNYDDYERARVAADELAKECAVFEKAYRKRLESQPEVLKVLEAFIQKRSEAIKAEITLIGGSWDGSGAKAAQESSRLKATLDYLEALRGLGASLHFQDMPELLPHIR